ncbi:MAG: proline--tRNA ligase [Candidatus Phytoplasma stylosanthis]|uniref:proline--tRNA ligase n=1 Tax=Candidatus Phytoplasma stylosanthis TaxID=2798314 RepID=UPI00293B2F80|nr:proline--tRNA ligase [Candidatus Phytoplasma stylosanthis]MDV3167973.1 proline--tRNA ligase [Candidatus Phytoplasma stylosanthis]MDV3170774.1 proline--tRNA ligase [Candidatus Phytoplasma stylosanthis]MDV3173552.1 proline--tRNA ligase [Candidatus Phytoplasma stylosanthis]MDV3174286.1 proline--tRNA ligase [Candidatus Phytoplasma stylosanthis]MDV3202737.1 proline--tRNA ligase [Candidatus Phytoplasma stylosanthis]
MKNSKLVKEIIPRNIDFGRWYQEVCLKSELIDYSDVKGFFIYLPYGYSIWESIKKFVDKKLKKTKHENVYFPLLFSENLFQKEKEHIHGFFNESLIIKEVSQKSLAQKLIIRPTSEVLFSQYYSKKIFSYRDLPKLFNQWTNVVRWEKSSKPFLRSKEFLWQEGHTAHATKKEALSETLSILNLYKKMGKEILAIPFISGKKTQLEKFKGSELTYSIEALMYDKQALQAGTSHYLGTKFSRVFDIKFQDSDLKTKFAEQTSFGISTRLIGALIMVHGDDEGLVIPPYISPIQIVIIPIQLKNSEVLEISKQVYKKLSKKYKVILDQQNKSIGWKFSYYELKGVPLRIEIGLKDLKENNVIVFIRHNFQKKIIKINDLFKKIPFLMKNIHKEMFQKALNHLNQNILEVRTYEDFKKNIKKTGYIKISVYENEAEKIIKEETGATARVIVKQKLITKICPVTKKKANQTILFARAY